MNPDHSPSEEGFPLNVLRTPGADTVSRLLDGWVGPGTTSAPRQPGPGEVPRILVEFHGVVAAHPGTFGQNHLLSLASLEHRDGQLIFLRENQNVCRWSIASADCGDADPPVWAGTDHLEREPERLSRFLLEVVLFELIMCHPVGGGASGGPDAAGRRAALQPLQRLDLGPLLWPPTTTFYAGRDKLAMLCDDGKNRPWLWISGLRKEAVSYLDPVVGPELNHSPWEGFSGWDAGS